MTLKFVLNKNVNNCKFGVLIFDFMERTLLTLYYDNPGVLENLALPGRAFWQIFPDRDIVWLRQFQMVEEYIDKSKKYAEIFSKFLLSRDKEKSYEEIREMIRSGEEEEYDRLFGGSLQWKFNNNLMMMERKVKKRKKQEIKNSSDELDEEMASKLMSIKSISDQMIQEDIQSYTIDKQDKKQTDNDDNEE